MAEDDGFIGLPPNFVPPVRPDSAVRPDLRKTEHAEAKPLFFPSNEVVTPAVRSWKLIVAHSDPASVDGPLYLGRNPVAGPEHPDARVLSIDDPGKSVSKTHALVEVEDDELWITDLDSTNGVWVVALDSEPVEAAPRRRERVPEGADIEIGDIVIHVGRS